MKKSFLFNKNTIATKTWLTEMASQLSEEPVNEHSRSLLHKCQAEYVKGFFSRYGLIDICLVCTSSYVIRDNTPTAYSEVRGHSQMVHSQILTHFTTSDRYVY